MEDDYGEEALETLIVYSFNVWKCLFVGSNPRFCRDTEWL